MAILVFLRLLAIQGTLTSIYAYLEQDLFLLLVVAFTATVAEVDRCTSILVGPKAGTEGPMTIYDPQTQIFRPEAFDGKAWRKHFLKKRRTFGERFSRASVITFNVHRDQLHVINYSPASRRSVSHIRHDDERALNLSAILHVNE